LVRIFSRKALTVEQLRGRLKTEMAKPITRRSDCTHCDGKGYIEKTGPMAMIDVARVTGMHGSTVDAFLKGRTNLTLEKGLRLMAWLDALEPPTDDELDELADLPVSPSAHEHATERRRRLINASAAAGANAAIESMNRPLVTRP
jgi:hypothetical protein